MIGLSPANDKNSQQRSGSCSPPPPAPRLAPAPSSAHPSPNLSVGPPAPPPPPPAPPAAPPGATPPGAGLYPFLLHPGLYQHLITGMNPMLLNAQLQALAASSNPLLGAWGAAAAHPSLLQMQQAAATAERLRALAGGTGATPTSVGSLSSHRYSPYPIPSPPHSSSGNSLSTSGSAFQAVKKPSIANDAPSSEAERGSPKSPESKSLDDNSNTRTENAITPPTSGNESKAEENNSSDIKNMEKLVNGLNGSSASKFGISHNNNDASSPTTQQPQISA